MSLSSDSTTVVERNELLDSQLRLVPAFYALQILGGMLGLGALLLTIGFARSVRRHSTVANLLFTWMFATVANCLLLFAGFPTQPDPPFGLCLAQAAILHGTLPMVTTALLAAMIQIWVMLRTFVGFKGRPDGKLANTHTIVLLVVPYLVFFAWMIPSYVIGASHHEAVSRHHDGFFCTVNPPPMSHYALAFSGALLFITLLFAAFIAATMYLNWKAVHNFNEGGVDTRLISRIVGFSIYNLLVAIVCLMSIHSRGLGTARDMFMATVPLVAFLIFATQADILRAWFLMKPAAAPDSLLPGPGDKGADEGGRKSTTMTIGATTPFRRDFDSGYEEAAWSPWRLPPAPYVTSPRSRDRDRDSLPPSQREPKSPKSAGGINERSRYGAVTKSAVGSSGRTPLKHDYAFSVSGSSAAGSGSGTKSDLAEGIAPHDKIGPRTLDTSAAEFPPGFSKDTGGYVGDIEKAIEPKQA